MSSMSSLVREVAASSGTGVMAQRDLGCSRRLLRNRDRARTVI
jgi:hypothetical protein